MPDNQMVLKFIGADRSMGLTYGGIYQVTLYVHRKYFYVLWQQQDSSGKWVVRKCPYISLKTFAENWELPSRM